MGGDLRVLSDDRGTIVMGSLADDVYYLRIVDTVSSDVGVRCASALRKYFSDVTRNFAIFLDNGSAQGSDLIARSAIMQVLLAKRKLISSVTVLVHNRATESRVRAMVELLETRVQIVDSATLFQARLREAAPTAPTRIPASGRIPAARSSMRPTARSSMRPIARSLAPRKRSRTGT